MTDYVILSGDLVAIAGRTRPGTPLPAGAFEVVVNADPGWTPQGAQLATSALLPVSSLAEQMRAGDRLVPRPAGPAPLVAGSDVTIPPSPLGTVVEVFDLIGDERMTELVADTEGWTETVSLTSAGRYEIEVTPPLPYLPAAVRVEL